MEIFGSCQVPGNHVSASCVTGEKKRKNIPVLAAVCCQATKCKPSSVLAPGWAALAAMEQCGEWREPLGQGSGALVEDPWEAPASILAWSAGASSRTAPCSRRGAAAGPARWGAACLVGGEADRRGYADFTPVVSKGLHRCTCA